jgi:hypothetical protein
VGWLDRDSSEDLEELDRTWPPRPSRTPSPCPTTADQIGRHDVINPVYALHTAADLVRATAVEGLSITIYHSGQIDLQISVSCGPAEARIRRVAALAAAFDISSAIPPSPPRSRQSSSCV